MKNTTIDEFIDKVTSQYKEEEDNVMLEEEEIDSLLDDDNSLLEEEEDDFINEEEEQEDFVEEDEDVVSDEDYVVEEEDISIEAEDITNKEVNTDKVYDLIKEIVDTINMSITDIIEINSDRVKVVVERLLEYIVAQSLTMRILDDFKQKFEKDEKVRLIINDKYLQDTFVLIDKINILKILLDIYFEENDIKDYLYRKIVDSFIDNKR